MTLIEAIEQSGLFDTFKRPQHAIAAYYNGHVKDAEMPTRLAMLSLEDLKADDWEIERNGRRRNWKEPQEWEGYTIPIPPRPFLK